ncbi:MAG: phasin family protein [Novosphingobium sp.]|nr:phasin family protein [Novosphingobium sp.]
MSKNANMSDTIKNIVADAQAKAKLAVEKGSDLFREAGEFTRGNVEAVVESGKILATGLQKMSKDIVADGRSVIETVTDEVKQIAAVKSPGELLKLQGEIARKNLDTALSLGSKNAEAVLKLAGDVIAPISGRLSLAAEKVRKLAA